MSVIVNCAAATPVYYSENGHYYDAISVQGGITWSNARIAAESLSYSGMNGHLATIASQNENDFIITSFGGHDYWLGGIQPSDSSEPAGGWQWVTDEPWVYINWDSGEPSNSYWGGYSINLPNGYPEDALHFHGNSRWNDVPKECPVPGYIVEYEAVSHQIPEPPVANFSTNVTSGYAPLYVQFTDLSKNSTVWNWDFGDGINSTEQSPTHTYSTAGNYIVNLTVNNANGTSSKTAIIEVKNPIGIGPYAYMPTDKATDNYVAIIDTSTDTITATVPIQYAVYGVAVNPTGTKVYMTNINDNKVSVFDTAINNVTAILPVGTNPTGITITPDGTKVYVANLNSNTVSVINTTTNTVSTVTVGNSPLGITVNPAGTKVYVVNELSDYLSVIDTATDTVTDTVPVGYQRFGIVINPSGTKAYVTTYAGDNANNIAVIDIATKAVTQIPVGSTSGGVTLSLDGTKAYVNCKQINKIVVIDTAKNTVLTSIDVGTSGHGVQVTPNGQKMFVANVGATNISVINMSTGNVTLVPVSNSVSFGQFIINLPPLKPLLPVANFSSNVTQGPAPLTVQFNENSLNVALWNWDFGDGNTSNEQSPMHTYSAAGNYIVNLTVSNTNGTSSKTATINVSALVQPILPVANFTVNVTEGYAPLYVQFTDLSENATEWRWDFGDGFNSTEQNPMHTYSVAGTYPVNLTVSNTNDVDSKLATITVTNPIILPQSVSDIQSSNGSTWINWTWKNPIDPNFNHTEIYLNGTFQSNNSAENFNATGLQPETIYTLSTRTADNNGNVNETWVNSTAITDAENVAEDFNISISTDKSIYDRGETVHITGKAQHIDGSPVVNAPALLNIILKGYMQTYSLVTDSNGNISYDFKTGKTEAGNFTAKLSVNSNGHLMSAETSFNMYGLYMVPSGTVDIEMSKKSSENITFSLRNYGETDLHGVNVQLDGETIPGVETQILQMPTETLSAGAQGSFIVKISSASVDVPQANYTVRVTSDEGSYEEAKLFVHFLEPRPVAIVNPMLIEVGMNPNNNLVKNIDISNVGHESMNDITISKPSLDWVSVSSTSLGSISPSMNKSLNIFLNPSSNTAVGVYQETISISSSNHQPVNVYLRISVTSSEKGDLRFHVVNEIGENISGASIAIQNPDILTEIFTGTTDENGYYTFENISAGTYNYFVTGSDHAVSGSSIVSPGIQTLVEPIIPKDILGVKLNVTLVRIDDDYVITPNFTFETDVPPPLLIPDPVAVIYGVDPLNPVYEKDGNITISNSGLISVFNVTVDSSALQGINITFPTGQTFFVDEIKAKSSITIPYHLKVNNVACSVDEYRNSIRISGDYIYFEPRSDVTHKGYVSSEIPVFTYMYNCPVDTPSLIEDYFTYTYNAPAASYSPIILEHIPQVETVHERVKFNIPQKATLERDAFSASLELTNKLTDKNIDNVSVNLTIKDKDGNDASSLFFVNQPSLSNINSISGSGIISPSSIANANWLLVPKNNAGGTYSAGRDYTVQAFINYTVNGVSFSINSTEESITVMPQPLLKLVYTIPENVTADKPLNLTLNVTNVGYGTAKNLKLDSAQPVIYENKAGLLVSFEIIDSGLVNGPESNSMLINFGDLAPGESKEAYWVMKTSLDGNFTEFYGSFSHNNTLGGAETSLINDIKYVILKIPVANFNADITQGYAPLSVQFTNLSINANNLEWDFGDNSSISHDQNPVHVYNEAGCYNVSLTAKNENGQDTKTVENYVMVESNKSIKFVLMCPVDMEIMDPDGLVISKQTNEIQGAVYKETDINNDGNLDDIVLIPEMKSGNYKVKVIPESDAQIKETDAYTLEASFADSHVVLAKDVLIKDHPQAEYVVSSEYLDSISSSSIQNLQFTNDITWINWTWTNPTDLDFSHTEIYLNNVFQTNTSAEYFNATGLEPETEYTISTRTADISSNVNETWVNSTATTLAELTSDTEKPVIKSLVLFPANTTAGSTMNVTATATDNIDVTGVTAGDVQLIKTNDTWNGSIIAPASIGNYSLLITAKDAAGNTAETTTDYKVVTPTGSLGVGISPKTTTAPTSGKTIDYTVKIKSIQNFDDIVRVNVTMDGLPASYQIPSDWFEWNNKTINIPSNSTVSLPLKLTIPPEQTTGRKVFKVRANSTFWITSAYDSGVITIS